MGLDEGMARLDEVGRPVRPWPYSVWHEDKELAIEIFKKSMRSVGPHQRSLAAHQVFTALADLPLEVVEVLYEHVKAR